MGCFSTQSIESFCLNCNILMRWKSVFTFVDENVFLLLIISILISMTHFKYCMLPGYFGLFNIFINNLVRINQFTLKWDNSPINNQVTGSNLFDWGRLNNRYLIHLKKSKTTIAHVPRNGVCELKLRQHKNKTKTRNLSENNSRTLFVYSRELGCIRTYCN